MQKIFITLLVILPMLSMTIIDLERKSILNDNGSIKIPNGFKELSKNEIVQKFPRLLRTGGTVFSNKNGTINLTINVSTEPANQDVIEKYRENYNDMLVNLYNTGYKKENNSGIINTHNQKVGFVKFLYPNKQKTKDYTLMFFTDYEEYLLVCTFSCPESEAATWEQTAEDIMNSLKIK